MEKTTPSYMKQVDTGYALGLGYYPTIARPHGSQNTPDDQACTYSHEADQI